MASLQLTKMSLRNAFKKPVTKLYPAEPPRFTARSKGQVQNDIEACIFCGICEKRCPTHALIVNRPNKSWTIDRFSCIQCLSCVRACPKKCLSMSPQYAPAAQEKSTETYQAPNNQEATD